jgi:hypothetical protein
MAAVVDIPYLNFPTGRDLISMIVTAMFCVLC